MAERTRPLAELANIEVADRAHLAWGTEIACLLSPAGGGEQVWMYCGYVRDVSDDGTLVVYEDYADRGPQWLVKSDWLARW